MQRDKDVKTESIEDTFMANMRLRENRKVGPDSYQAVMAAKRPSRKRDLKKIEEWLKARSRAAALKREAGKD